MSRDLGPRCLVVAAALAGGCGPSSGGTLEGLYGSAPPSRVKVIQFQADTLGMDPSFAWELAPIDEAYLKTLVKDNAMVAPPDGESIPSAGYDWPDWWETERIEALPERYHNDASGLRRIWVDRENDRLYIEFVGT